MIPWSARCVRRSPRRPSGSTRSSRARTRRSTVRRPAASSMSSPAPAPTRGMDRPSRSFATRASRRTTSFPEPNTLQQNQYGASLSGPILRDQLFFFAVAERLTVDDARFVQISEDDADIFRAAGFDIQTGVVPFDRNGDNFFGRLDFLPSPSNTFSLRGTYGRSHDENQQSWGGIVARSSGGVGASRTDRWD